MARSSATSSAASAATVWMRDEDSQVCLLCGSQFSFLLRRHHCRQCQRLVCASCSSHTAALPTPDGLVLPDQRICDDCFAHQADDAPAADEPGTECALCAAQFGLTLWRHSCRVCFKHVCGTCSSKSAVLTQDEAAQRVCDECYPAITGRVPGGEGTTPVLVSLLEARALAQPDGGAPLDSYCALYVGGGNVGRSRSQPDASPAWDEEFVVRMPPAMPFFVLEVWDRAGNMGANLLGRARVRVAGLAESGESHCWHRLVDPAERAAGFVRLRVTLRAIDLPRPPPRSLLPDAPLEDVLPALATGFPRDEAVRFDEPRMQMIVGEHGFHGRGLLTTHRLLFLRLGDGPPALSLPLASVRTHKVAALSLHTGRLDIHTADARRVQLVLSDESAPGAAMVRLRVMDEEIYWAQLEDEFASTRRRVAQPVRSTPGLSPVRSYRRRFAATPPVGPDGADWDPAAEFERLGVFSRPGWRVTAANQIYALCATYPRVLVVPTAVSDRDLELAAAFRSKQRLPALTWLHPESGAPLCRSSQPRVGVTSSACPEDEQLLRAIRDCGGGGTLRIVDARPLINAVGNQLIGKGAEVVSRIGDATLTFLNVANIHVMRESLASVTAAVVDDAGGNWLLDVHQSKWLHHAGAILRGAVEIARHLERGDAVLVHCSDGWDRTAQLCATAQLLLDPHYRTLDGFATLVEKDWCAFGHRFQARSCSADESAPVFLQWLDVVWQLMQQFPAAFEFSDALLLYLHEAAHARWHRTFLRDCERERRALVAGEDDAPDTCSVWELVRADDDSRRRFRSVLFEPILAALEPRCAPRDLQVWRRLHFSHVPAEARPHPIGESRVDMLERLVRELRSG